MNGLEPRGGTALHSAMKKAADVLLSAYPPGNKEMPRHVVAYILVHSLYML